MYSLFVKMNDLKRKENVLGNSWEQNKSMSHPVVLRTRKDEGIKQTLLEN